MKRFARLLILILSIAIAGYFTLIFAGQNEHTVIDRKIYRAAQMSGPQLAQAIEKNQIRTLLNLRGCAQSVSLDRAKWYRDEVIATHAVNTSQEDVTLSAMLLPPPSELARAIEVLDQAEAPILIHCKQGADRTGLIAAIARLLYTDDTLDEARRELWPIYGHFPVGRTVAMDDFLNRYETWLNGKPHAPLLFREFALNYYRPGPASATLAWQQPPPKQTSKDQSFVAKLLATNTSREDWEFRPGNYAGIYLLYKVVPNLNQESYRGQAGLFTKTVHPGESIVLSLPVPPLKVAGNYTIVAELIDARQAGVSIRTSSFVKFGSEPILAQVAVQ